MPGTRDSRDLQIIDPVLTEVAKAFRPTGFVADQLLPSIPVDLDAGQYPVFPAEYWFRRQTNPKVSDRALTPEVDFIWSTDSYLCEDYRLKATITAKERRQAHPALRLERQKLELVLNQMAMWREKQAADLLRNTANGGALTGGTASPSTKWDQSNATIESDIKTGKIAVYRATGMVPNTIVIPYLVACEIADDATIRDLIKYTVNGLQVIDLGEKVLPSSIWGMRVMVPMGVLEDTGTEGAAASTSMTEIWSDNVRLLYVAPNGGGWGIPSVGYRFKSQPEVVDRWSEKDPPVDNIRAWETRAEKVCAPELGYELSNVLNGV